MSAKPYITIEPERGATYSSDKFAAYEYSVWPRHSVLAGQQKRRWLDSFDTVEDAKAAFPEATVTGDCVFVEPCLSHLPDEDGPDPFGDNAEAARENE